MKRYISGILVLLTVLNAPKTYAQDETKPKEKKKFKLEKPKLNVREKLGDITGNLMTSKTADISVTAPMVTLITGIYSKDTKTSESKYFPDDSQEGDHMMAITFMKNDGFGMYKIEGEVSVDGTQAEYPGLGSYMYNFDKPVDGPKTMKVKTESGQEASFTIEPLPTIEILSINGDNTFPIIDLKEDLKIKFTHPEGAEGTNVKVGLLTDVAGARAWNFFAEFKSTADEVTIPSESFSNLEISGQLNAGQVNRGTTYLVVMRERVIQESELKEGQVTGPVQGTVLKAQSYGVKGVLVKGKQENGVIAEVKFAGRIKDELSYAISKPNATKGIPFSKASRFGLVSMSIDGKTFKKETESGSNTYYSGGSQYTATWTRTTTYTFPQLPNGHWDAVMDAFYQKFTAMSESDLSVEYIPVDSVTGSPKYQGFYALQEQNSSEEIKRTYKNTLSLTPINFGQFWANRSSSQTGDTPDMLLMKDLNVDGLVSLNITFDVGANENDQVVLLPKVSFSIKGRDETRDNKSGTYADGFIQFQRGVPFSEEKLKNDPNYLVEVLNIDEMVAGIRYMIQALIVKEKELGFEEIWSIGQ